MSQPISYHQDRWQRAVDARHQWTRDAWIDMRFEANKAWSNEELEIFRAQNRAPSNYPLIRPVINLVCGIEAQTRSDLLILPRTSKTKDSAEALTKLTKYVDDQNQTPRHFSRSFRDMGITGLGFLYSDYNPNRKRERIRVRRVSPFDVWTDPSHKESDLSDALDVFYAPWLYPQHLAMLFPNMRKDIACAAGLKGYDPLSHTADYTNEHGDRPPVSLFNGGVGDSEYAPGHGLDIGIAPFTQEVLDYRTDRYEGLIQVVERWYRVDEMAQIAVFKNGLTLEVTPENAGPIARGMLEGQVMLETSMVSRVRVAIFCGDLLLQDAPSPFSHDLFPITQMQAYEDEEGVPMGLVRHMRDATKEFNARRTHMLKRSLGWQTWFEEGAFVDEQEAVAELQKHNGVVRFVQGGLSSQRALIRNDMQSNQTDATLMAEAQKMVQDQGGATAELLGQETNATSGKAIQSRQAQGQTALYTLFEARNWAQAQVGERVLSMIQDTYTDEMEVRITGKDSSLKFMTINQKDESGAVVNDITQGRYDVIVSQQPASATEKAARAERMGQFLSGLDPAIKLMFATDMAEANDMPEDFVAKLGEAVDKLLATAQQPQVPPEGMPPQPPGAEMPGGFPMPPAA